MKIDFNRKINGQSFLNWLFVAALLALTLSFPSARESQTLCLRWLLHLNGHTTVQGRPDGYSSDLIIPKVQFSPEYEHELLFRSTNSLADYFLATPTDFDSSGTISPLPKVESAWTNSPFLPEMTFFMACRSTATNAHALSPASLNDVRTLIQLARMTNPNNGAFSQAEACFDFAVHDNQSALQALWTSGRNQNWTLCLATTFSAYSDLFERAGLSKLDATIQALRIDPMFGSSVSLRNNLFLDGLMTQAVNDGNSKEFTNLFCLLVELRRADWSDKLPEIYNHYRRFDPSGRLVEAMAVPLNIKLATNWFDLRYDQVKLIRQQVFQGYLRRYGDPITTAVFNTQTAAYETERRLKDQVSERTSPCIIRLALGNLIAGGLSLLLLSLLCSALMIHASYRRLRSRITQGKPWRRDPLLWMFSAITILLCTVIFSCFLHTVELADFDNFPQIEFPPLAMAGFFGVLFSTWLAYRLRKWKRGYLPNNSWKAIRFFAMAYLLSIFAMAFFRSELVSYIAAQYQS